MADPLDLLTLEEGYRAVSDPVNTDAVAAGGGGTHDTRLALWITAVSRRVDDICGPVVIRTVTNELHDGGRNTIVLDKGPVSSVTSVTEYDGTTATTLTAETNATKPTDAYLVEREGRVVFLRRRSSDADKDFEDGRNNIEVTYEAGRYADTASVDAKFKEAASAVLRRIQKREGGAWAQGADPFARPPEIGFFRAMDPMIEEFLGDELEPDKQGLLIF